MPHCSTQHRKSAGFTLVEVVFVVVILGIVGIIGSHFVVTSLQAYRVAEQRNDIVQRGRLTLEQMSRELRMALPNAIRVSPSGQCIEFLPVVGASHYHGLVADVANQMAPQNSVSTGAFSAVAAPKHAVIAPFSPIDVFTSSSPAARVALGNIGLGPYTAVNFAASHRFLSNSLARRLYLVGDPVRFCFVGDDVWRYSNYGLSTASLSDTNPGGDSALMSHRVTPIAPAFSLSPGSEDRNMVIRIQAKFHRETTSLDLSQQVFVRNVP